MNLWTHVIILMSWARFSLGKSLSTSAWWIMNGINVRFIQEAWDHTTIALGEKKSMLQDKFSDMQFKISSNDISFYFVIFSHI